MHRGNGLLVVSMLVLVTTAAAAQSEEPATVKHTAEDVIALFTFEDRSKLRVTTEPTRVRPGTWWTKEIQLFQKDDRDRVWEMRSTQQFGSVKIVVVAPGQEKILHMGPPIGMVLYARTGQNVPAGIVKFTLRAAGRSSESYYPGAFLAGKKPPAPALRITDPDGKVLETARFNVTAAGACTFDWRYPKDFTGVFNVEIDPLMGPFKWELVKQGTYAVAAE